MWGLKLAIKIVAELLASEPLHKCGGLFEHLPSLLCNNPRLKKIKRVMTQELQRSTALSYAMLLIPQYLPSRFHDQCGNRSVLMGG